MYFIYLLQAFGVKRNPGKIGSSFGSSTARLHRVKCAASNVDSGAQSWNLPVFRPVDLLNIGYSERTGQKTGESHLCAVSQRSAKSTRTESKISEENQLQQACVKTSNQIIGAKQINKR